MRDLMNHKQLMPQRPPRRSTEQYLMVVWIECTKSLRPRQ